MRFNEVLAIDVAAVAKVQGDDALSGLWNGQPLSSLLILAVSLSTHRYSFIASPRAALAPKL